MLSIHTKQQQHKANNNISTIQTRNCVTAFGCKWTDQYSNIIRLSVGFKGGEGWTPLLAQNFFQKAAFFRVKDIQSIVCICDKWRRDWWIVFRPTFSKFLDRPLVRLQCDKSLIHLWQLAVYRFTYLLSHTLDGMCRNITNASTANLQSKHTVIMTLFDGHSAVWIIRIMP